MHLRDTDRWKTLLAADSILRHNEHEQLSGRWWGADIMPLPLAEKLVELTSAPGDLVLDPFAGIGTIGVAAVMHGRRFVGFETDAVRYASGQSHFTSDQIWRNESIDQSDIEIPPVDAIVTSPPYGRKEPDRRVFDRTYFEDMRRIVDRLGSASRDHAVALIEVMNWPEYEGGEELAFWFLHEMRRDWIFVRELVFMNLHETKISTIAHHTWLMIWMRKSRI